MKAVTDSFRGLMAAVINRALADLEKNNTAMMGASGHVRDEAMAWINSPECEAFCHALDADYRTIREKAASLYRRFLEKAEGCEKASRAHTGGAITVLPRTDQCAFCGRLLTGSGGREMSPRFYKFANLHFCKSANWHISSGKIVTWPISRRAIFTILYFAHAARYRDHLAGTGWGRA
jgi:hypothetical protein